MVHANPVTTALRRIFFALLLFSPYSLSDPYAGPDIGNQLFFSLNGGLRPGVSNIAAELGPLLSSTSLITSNISAFPRWSEYGAPEPLVTVKVGIEEDVATTVSRALSTSLCYTISYHFGATPAAHSAKPSLLSQADCFDIRLNIATRKTFPFCCKRVEVAGATPSTSVSMALRSM